MTNKKLKEVFVCVVIYDDGTEAMPWLGNRNMPFPMLSNTKDELEDSIDYILEMSRQDGTPIKAEIRRFISTNMNLKKRNE